MQQHLPLLCTTWLTICVTLLATPAAASYLSTRAAFITAEDSKSINTPRNPPQNPHFANAEKHLASLIAHERSSQDDPYQTYPPAQDFMLPAVRDRVARSPLYKALQHMPKGSVLHAHSTSFAPVDVAVNITYLPDCYVWTRPGTPGGIPRMAVRFFPKRGPAPTPGWQPISTARAQSGNATAFDMQLRDAMLVDHNVPRGDVNGRWNSFQNGSLAMVLNLLAYTKYLPLALESMHADGVQYVSLRHVPGMMFNEDGATISIDDEMTLIKSLIDKTAKSLPTAFTARVILCELRFANNTVTEPLLQRAIAMYKKHPDLVTGFDLVGQEAAWNSRSLLDYEPLLSKYAGQIPYVFHAGETKQWPTSMNLVDAVLLNTTRIGHGYALSYHPLVEEEVTRRGIYIEVCPISNQVLGLVDDLRNHPARGFLARGLPVTISPDDPQMFGSHGVSFDYYMVAAAWNVTLSGLQNLALNSLKAAPVPATEHTALMQAWSTAWDAFVTYLATGQDDD